MPIPNNETRFFQLQLRTGSVTGPVQITSNVVTVVSESQAFITATGGFVTLEDGYKTHHFDSSNTFQVSGLGIPSNRTIEYFVVAGGGAGGSSTGFPNSGVHGGGGGAGGIQSGNITLTSTGSYVALVGAGGASGTGTNGSNSNITLAGVLNIVAFGGGAGGMRSGYPSGRNANIGGSGGGAAGMAYRTGNAAGWVGQGFPGGQGNPNPSYEGGGGGGGAGQAGLNCLAPAPGGAVGNYPSGQGGNGISRSWIFPAYGVPETVGSLLTGSPTDVSKNRWFGGGGAGWAGGTNGARGDFPENSNWGWGGMGGGGGALSSPPRGTHVMTLFSAPEINGRATSGGGGGGGGANPYYDKPAGGGGGSGLIAIRYPYTIKTYNIYDTVGFAKATYDNSNVVYTLNTVNVSNATVLYWTLSGNVLNGDVVGGNTGSFTVINANATLTLTLANNIVTGSDTKNYALQLRTSSIAGPVVATGNTIVIYNSNDPGTFISATGGNVTVSGGYKTHVFFTSNNFAVSSAGRLGGLVDYLIVAGGGGGQTSPRFNYGGGGAGAGGLLTGATTLTAQTYVANVGGGGSAGTNGSNSSIFSLTAVGGGFGGAYNTGTLGPSGNGGSGGGATSEGELSPYNGAGAGISGQGYPGGQRQPRNPAWGRGGAGGGAGGAGGDASGYAYVSVGGIGRPISWVPTYFGDPGPQPGRYFAGGGGAGGHYPNSDGFPQNGCAGGVGGGGLGGSVFPSPSPSYNGSGFAGNVNTGGGGGGSGSSPVGPGGTGGSGIIIIRYPYK